MKDLNYYKNNCEEDYIKTPISVLRYITELEKKNEAEQLILSGVSHRREMLIRFYIETCNKTITRQYAEDIVDNYLS